MDRYFDIEYRPVLTDAEEEQQEMEYALEECMDYLRLAIDSLNGYRNFEDLQDDLEMFLEAVKDEQKEIREYE